jgi:hypothetical protein
MDTDDLPAEALAGAAVGAALTVLVMNPKVRSAARRGAVWALCRLLEAKDAAHAAVKGMAEESGVPPEEADRAADIAEGVAGSAARSAGT